MPPGLGQDKPALIRVTSGNPGLRSFHCQTMQRTHVHFSQRRSLTREFTHLTNGCVMIDRLHVILERFATDRDPLFTHQRCLGCGERVPFNRVRRVGDFKIVDML